MWLLFRKWPRQPWKKFILPGIFPYLSAAQDFTFSPSFMILSLRTMITTWNTGIFSKQPVKKNGPLWLHGRLEAVDPQAAAEIHANNVKKVIRALEYYHKTGQKISEHNRIQRMKPSPYRFVYFVLEQERKTLYERIEKRIDQMLSQGLVDEVGRLLDMGYSRDLVSMQGLGYKEIIDYLQGRISFDEAVYILKRDTRHFAKRQMTWFRRERMSAIFKKNSIRMRSIF